MRKYVILLILIFCGISQIRAQQISIDKVRDQFFAWDKTEDGALKLYKSLEKADLTKDPLLLAYRGASSAAAAGSVSGVWKKLEYFNRGKGELEKAVGLKHLDAEIRFLRLATQLNAPGFLGYSSDIKNDKSIIINTLKGVNANHPNAYLYLRICRFMLAHAELDAAETNTLNQLIVKFKPNK
ncbi:MAG: hypothetical protein Q7U54_08610 [Bacteroidales bacterium]|nr:hypothetical protein [Bacteroidales bacterium]